jgi:hypothetical protein
MGALYWASNSRAYVILTLTHAHDLHLREIVHEVAGDN